MSEGVSTLSAILAASPPAAFIVQLWRRQHSRVFVIGAQVVAANLTQLCRLRLRRQCNFGGCAVAANINSAEGRIGGSAVAAKANFGGHSAAGKVTQLWRGAVSNKMQRLRPPPLFLVTGGVNS